jgi:hypothetical protein
MVVLDIPEWHPLRDRGKDQLPPIPAEWEQEFRSLLNNAVRRAEVEQAQGEVQQAAAIVNEAQATAEFWQERALFFATNPDIAMRVAHMRESLGDAEAQRYVAGLMQEDVQNLQSKLAEASNDTAQQQTIQRAQQFVNLARNALSQRYPDRPMNELNNLIAQYGTMVEVGQYAEPHADTLFELADKMLGKPMSKTEGAAAQPESAPATVDIEELRAQITAEVIEQMQAQQAEGQNRATNPMGNVPRTISTRQGGVAPPQAPQQQGGEQGSVDVPNIRRNLRKNIRLGGRSG